MTGAPPIDPKLPIRGSFIGRETQAAAMDQAFKQRGVVLLQGGGGMGKSMLLQHQQAQLEQQPGILHAGIIDFQRGRYHQRGYLLDSLRQRLTATDQGAPATHFATYDIAREKERHALHEISAESINAFRDAYQHIAATRPMVLSFDTIERLRTTFPELHAYDFLVNERFEQWLFNDLLAPLPNTTIYLAGRPSGAEDAQTAELANTFQQRLMLQQVDQFTLDEVAAYLQHNTILHLSDEQISRAHANCQGHPILLALLVSLAKLPPNPSETSRLFDAETSRLFDSEISRLFDEEYQPQQLISEVFAALQDARFGQIGLQMIELIKKAFYFQRGLSSDLLINLDRNEQAEALTLQLEQFGKMAFVKRIGNEKARTPQVWRYMLHDELLNIAFEHLQHDKEKEQSYQAALAHLRKEERALTQASAHQSADPVAYAAERRDRHELIIDQLFYQILANPLSGYLQLRQQFASVIRERNHDVDRQLQGMLGYLLDTKRPWGQRISDQLARANYPRERVLFDEALRWVRRRLVTNLPEANRYTEAEEGLRAIERDPMFVPFYSHTSPNNHEFTILDLRIRTFLNSGDPQLAARYTALITTLEAAHQQHGATDQHWLQQELLRQDLAEAYNHHGYYLRLNQRNQPAINAYRKALEASRTLGREVRGERIQYLVNLSYVYHLEGDSDKAERTIAEAQRLARVEGPSAEHLYAIALNTGARIRLLYDAQGALADAEEAFAIFTRRNSRRNLALCHYVLGEIKNRIAYLFLPPPKRRRKLLDQAATHYRKGLKIFQSPEFASETLRRIDGHMGLASVLRSLGVLMFGQSDPASAEAKLQKGLAELVAAEELLNALYPLPAAERPASHLLHIALREDRAVILLIQSTHAAKQGHADRAQALLEASHQVVRQARRLMPIEFVIAPSADELNERDKLNTPMNEPDEPLPRAFWLRGAQLDLQLALYAADSSPPDPDTFCRHALFALTGLIRFSRRPLALDTFCKLIEERLGQLARNTYDQHLQPKLKGRAEIPSIPSQRQYMLQAHETVREQTEAQLDRWQRTLTTIVGSDTDSHRARTLLRGRFDAARDQIALFAEITDEPLGP